MQSEFERVNKKIDKAHLNGIMNFEGANPGLKSPTRLKGKSLADKAAANKTGDEVVPSLLKPQLIKPTDDDRKNSPFFGV